MKMVFCMSSNCFLSFSSNLSSMSLNSNLKCPKLHPEGLVLVPSFHTLYFPLRSETLVSHAGCESSFVTLLRLSRNRLLSCSSSCSSHSQASTSSDSLVEANKLNRVCIIGLVEGVFSISACPKWRLFQSVNINYISFGQ